MTDISDILLLFESLETELNELSERMKSLKRENGFLSDVKSEWVDDLSRARSKPDDKADTS